METEYITFKLTDLERIGYKYAFSNIIGDRKEYKKYVKIAMVNREQHGIRVKKHQRYNKCEWMKLVS